MPGKRSIVSEQERAGIARMDAFAKSDRISKPVRDQAVEQFLSYFVDGRLQESPEDVRQIIAELDQVGRDVSDAIVAEGLRGVLEQPFDLWNSDKVPSVRSRNRFSKQERTGITHMYAFVKTYAISKSDRDHAVDKFRSYFVNGKLQKSDEEVRQIIAELDGTGRDVSDAVVAEGLRGALEGPFYSRSPFRKVIRKADSNEIETAIAFIDARLKQPGCKFTQEQRDLAVEKIRPVFASGIKPSRRILEQAIAALDNETEALDAHALKETAIPQANALAADALDHIMTFRSRGR